MRSLSKSEEEAIYALAERLTGSSQRGRWRKSVLIQNVARRISATGSQSLVAYLGLVDRDDREARQLVSALTIHHTAFFREAEHFEAVLKEIDATRDDPRAPVTILCAACSSGEEVYSLAMVLEAKRQLGILSDYKVVGVDIDAVSVGRAAKGVYRAERATDVPASYRRFLLTGQGKAAGFVAIDPEVRRRTRFFPADLRVVQAELAQRGEKTFDAILCRNVLIYFDDAGVAKVVRNLLGLLRRGGLLALGHSESIEAASFGIEARGRALYRVPLGRIANTAAKGGQASPRALVVDDAASVRKVLATLLSRGGFEVETAGSAAEASRIVERVAVDVVTLDLGMPEVDGATWLRQQRQRGFKAPVVIVSDANPSEAEEVFGALTSGAQDYFEKSLLHQAPEQIVERLRQIVHKGEKSAGRLDSMAPATPVAAPPRFRPELLVIGASTGGTDALVRLLNMMPAGTPPLLVVQHISPAFAKPFAERLARAAGLKLALPVHDMPLEDGTLYMALGDYHIGVRRTGGRLRLRISQDPAEHSVRPAADYLFRTVASAKGRALGMLLTGMGRDGAMGLLELAQAGCATFAQDEASCVVFGMPREAIRLGAAQGVFDIPGLRRELEISLQSETARVRSA